MMEGVCCCCCWTVWRYAELHGQIHSEISLISPTDCTWVKKYKIWPRFSTAVTFEAPWFQHRAIYQKCKTCIGMIRLNNDSEISPINSLIFMDWTGLHHLHCWRSMTWLSDTTVLHSSRSCAILVHSATDDPIQSLMSSVHRLLGRPRRFLPLIQPWRTAVHRLSALAVCPKTAISVVGCPSEVAFLLQFLPEWTGLFGALSSWSTTCVDMTSFQRR